MCGFLNPCVHERPAHRAKIRADHEELRRNASLGFDEAGDYRRRAGIVMRGCGGGFILSPRKKLGCGGWL